MKNNVAPMETNESSPSQKVSHLLAIIYIYRTLLLANDSWISVINFNFITLQIICTHLLGGCWLMLIIKFSEFISLVCWKTKHFFDNWKISKGEITYNVVLDLAFSVLPCFFLPESSALLVFRNLQPCVRLVIFHLR